MKFRIANSTAIPIIALLLIPFAFSSCKKKCELLPDSSSGDIVPNAVVLESSVGYNLVVRGESKPGTYKVSFDGGVSYGQIDFSKYLLLAQPLSVRCHSSVDKTVTIDKTKKRVEYEVIVTECPTCNDLYPINNWVLVPRFPDNYNVIFRKRIVEKED